MRKIIREAICVLLSVGIILMQMPSVAYADLLYMDYDQLYDIQVSEENIGNEKDAAIEILQQIQNVVAEDGVVLNVYEKEKLPFEKDLTTDKDTAVYMPDVKNQGQDGTCAAFSSIYYQYSYEVNRRNKITSENDKITYSPHYAFSYGYNSTISNYWQIQERGCITYDEWQDEHGEQMQDKDSNLLYSTYLTAAVGA